MENKVERHMEVCLTLNDIYNRKNHDYGDSFHDTFLEEGYAMARIRLSDKLNRFKTLSRCCDAGKDSEDAEVVDETMRDTLLDLANYAIMTVMEMDIQAETEIEKVKAMTEKLTADALYTPPNYVTESLLKSYIRSEPDGARIVGV